MMAVPFRSLGVTGALLGVGSLQFNELIAAHHRYLEICCDGREATAPKLPTNPLEGVRSLASMVPCARRQ